MNTLKRINELSGFVTAVTLLTGIIYVMCVPMEPHTPFHYIVLTILLVFGSVFLSTCGVFILMSMVWHIQHKRVRLFLRHYLYAVLAAFSILVLFRYIAIGGIDGLHALKYCFALALAEPYLSGIKNTRLRH